MKKLLFFFTSMTLTIAIHSMMLVKKLKLKQISTKIPTNFIAPFMSISPAQSIIKDNDFVQQKPDQSSFFAPPEQRRRTKKTISLK